MFEKEIEFIYKYNLNKIKHLGSFITYEQLIPANVHPALLQYLSAEIDFLIYEDRQKLLKDSLFDYSGDKIIEYFSLIGEEIKKTKKFSIDYLSKLLLHASSFNANFIVRPKWSLLQFIFENENEGSKSISEIKQILNYLYYYPYLKRLLINFFNKKRMMTISYTELKELLDKIDMINYETNFEKVLDSALTNMAEFIYMGELQNKKVSRQFLEIFLADKGLKQFKVVLTEKFGVNNSDRFEISELKNTILNYKDFVYNANDEFEETEYSVGVEQVETDTDSIEETSAREDETMESKIASEQDIGLSTEEEQNNSEEEFHSYISEENEEDLEDEEVKKKKSFLEAHLDKLEDDNVEAELKVEGKEIISDTEEDEMEPPEFDEAPRIDEKNVDEIYELAIEEESIDTIVEEDEADLPRIEITEEDENPFDETDIDELHKHVDDVAKESLDEEIPLTESDLNVDMEDDEEKENEDGYIKEGTSITFSMDELNSDNTTVKDENEEKIDEWPTETSSDGDIVDALLDEEGENEESVATEELIQEVVEDEKLVNDKIESKENDAEEDNEESETLDDDFESQQMLFKEEDLEEISVTEESEEEDTEDENISTIDISGLLEDKRITKIIEVIFDYDMEEFANAIDEIAECNSEAEAHKTIDNIAQQAFIDKSTKEIKVFKNIISDFFK